MNLDESARKRIADLEYTIDLKNGTINELLMERRDHFETIARLRAELAEVKRDRTHVPA